MEAEPGTTGGTRYLVPGTLYSKFQSRRFKMVRVAQGTMYTGTLVCNSGLPAFRSHHFDDMMYRNRPALQTYLYVHFSVCRYYSESVLLNYRSRAQKGCRYTYNYEDAGQSRKTRNCKKNEILLLVGLVLFLAGSCSKAAANISLFACTYLIRITAYKIALLYGGVYHRHPE